MSWDSQVHCFEPDRHAYSDCRSYTPRPAPLIALLQNLLTDNFMLVQATIENGHDGLLARLNECRQGVDGYSGLVRGTVLAVSGAPLLTTSEDELFRMHNLGVRCIRLHGLYGGSGHNTPWTLHQLQALARSKPVQMYGWSISAQLPLHTHSRTWLRCTPTISGSTNTAPPSKFRGDVPWLSRHLHFLAFSVYVRCLRGATSDLRDLRRKLIQMTPLP